MHITQGQIKVTFITHLCVALNVFYASFSVYAGTAASFNNEAITLTPVWAPQAYAVTYDANNATGGTAPAAQTKANKVKLTLSGNTGNLVRVGYTFSGWNTAAKGTGTSYATNAIYTADAALALYAKWVANTYTVAYNGNGSTAGATANSTHTYNVQALLTANRYTRTGYSYVGWGTNATGEVIYTNRQAVLNLAAVQGATFTVYASWTANVYKVTFDANGGGLGTSNVMATYGAPMPAASGASRNGYAFDGYFDARAAGIRYYTAAMASATNWNKAAAATLYARWIPYTYSVDYIAVNATGGTAPVSQVKTNDVSLTLRANTGSLARTGYTFGGWNTAADGLGKSYKAGGAYTNNAAATLYSTWIPNTYAITYNANGSTSGKAPASQTKTNDAALLLRTNSGNLVKTGYTFSGWNTAANGTGMGYAAGAAYLANSAATLYAKWTLNTYAVTYDANNATAGGAPAGQLKTYGVSLALSGNTGNLIRVGYTFAGWNTASNGMGTSYATNASYTANAALALYAKWTTNTYTVAYNGNRSTGGATANSAHTYNVTALLTANGYTRTGYSFAGWGTNALSEVVYTNKQNVLNLTAVQGATFTLYASWTGSVYKVTFNANGGVLGTSNVMASYGAPMPVGVAPVYRGYAFAGYFTASTGGTQYYDATMKSLLNWDKMVATTLYAQWTVLRMTTTTVPVPITWMDQYPALLSAQGGDYNTAANAIGANGYPVWESYLAGLNPLNPRDRFLADITFSNGLKRITWSPNLGAGRKYTIEGKTNLTDSAWHSPTNSGSRFFKVKVEMP